MASKTPEQITRAELARRLDVSKPYITKLGKLGLLVLQGSKVLYEPTLERITQHRDPARTKPESKAAKAKPKAAKVEHRGEKDSSGTGFYKARAEKEALRAKKLRIEIEQLEGELIPRAEVEKFVFEVLRATRTKIEAMPVKLAPIVAPLDEKQAVADVIDEEVRNILSDLADALLGIPDAVAGKNS